MSRISKFAMTRVVFMYVQFLLSVVLLGLPDSSVRFYNNDFDT